jgi:hypothetical protein
MRLYKCLSFNVGPAEPQPVSSPIVKLFDQLAQTHSSASERKRRREKLMDQDVVKSAAKSQAVVHALSNAPDHQHLAANAHSSLARAPYIFEASPAWDGSAQRVSASGGVPLPRSALSSPQLSVLFASPDRARIQSDEEKRYWRFVVDCICKRRPDSRIRTKCRRWVAHAVLSRVEDTLNQYARTKLELEHLKKHKVMPPFITTCAACTLPRD